MGHPSPWARGPVPSPQLQPSVLLEGGCGDAWAGRAEMEEVVQSPLEVPSRPCWCADSRHVGQPQSPSLSACEFSPGLRCPPGPGTCPVPCRGQAKTPRAHMQQVPPRLHCLVESLRRDQQRPLPGWPSLVSSHLGPLVLGPRIGPPGWGPSSVGCTPLPRGGRLLL